MKENEYAVPNIQNIIEQTEEKRFFKVINLINDYYQIKVKNSINIKWHFVLIISFINRHGCYKISRHILNDYE